MKNIDHTPRATWLVLLIAMAPLSMGARGCKDSEVNEGGAGAAAGGGSSTAGSGAGTGQAGTGKAGEGGGAGNSAGTGGGCVVSGKTYKPGEAVPSLDGCNSCACTESGIACTEKACIGDACGGIAGIECKKDGEFCQFDPTTNCGAGDQQGHCSTKPEGCTDDYTPVCGCDDKTYSNACNAAIAGISVASQGECGTAAACKEDDDCPQPSCACLDENHDGTCENHCPTFGCRKGECVDISADRSCGGLLGAQCEDGEFCNYPLDAICGAADATGICEAQPGSCTKELKQVCGCDDKTYGNECTANKAGTSVSKLGACK